MMGGRRVAFLLSPSPAARGASALFPASWPVFLGLRHLHRSRSSYSCSPSGSQASQRPGAGGCMGFRGLREQFYDGAEMTKLVLYRLGRRLGSSVGPVCPQRLWEGALPASSASGAPGCPGHLVLQQHPNLPPCLWCPTPVSLLLSVIGFILTSYGSILT